MIMTETEGGGPVPEGDSRFAHRFLYIEKVVIKKQKLFENPDEYKGKYIFFSHTSEIWREKYTSYYVGLFEGIELKPKFMSRKKDVPYMRITNQEEIHNEMSPYMALDTTETKSYRIEDIDEDVTVVNPQLGPSQTIFSFLTPRERVSFLGIRRKGVGVVKRNTHTNAQKNTEKHIKKNSVGTTTTTTIFLLGLVWMRPLYFYFL